MAKIPASRENAYGSRRSFIKNTAVAGATLALVPHNILEGKGFQATGDPQVNAGASAGEKKLNNLVSVLLEATSVSKSGTQFTFTRSRDGWIFISSSYEGKGTVRIILDKASGGDAVIVHDDDGSMLSEGMRYVKKGKHTIHVESKGKIGVQKLVVKAIPELIHCGLGFGIILKSFGPYDLNFLKKDVLPNVTTMVVPHNIQLSSSVIDDWHRQGKKFIAEPYHRKRRKLEEVNKFSGTVNIEGVDVDTKRSFAEMYSSSPEPPMGVWMTYHWKVFRSLSPTATLIVSDWPRENEPRLPVGLEQIFNFLEIQPYHD